MVCGKGETVWFPLRGWGADSGVMGGSGRRAVVRSGCDEYWVLIRSSVGVEAMVDQASLDMVLLSCPL